MKTLVSNITCTSVCTYISSENYLFNAVLSVLYSTLVYTFTKYCYKFVFSLVVQNWPLT